MALILSLRSSRHSQAQTPRVHAEDGVEGTGAGAERTLIVLDWDPQGHGYECSGYLLNDMETLLTGVFFFFARYTVV